MPQKFYRVELKPIDTDKIYHSEDFAYGSNFDFKYYQHFINTYLRVMHRNNISADFLVTLNNQIYMTQGDYLAGLANAIVNEEYIDLYKVTNNDHHKNQTIPISCVNDFVQSFDEMNPFILFNNGTYLWEIMNEAVRNQLYKSFPKRLSSVFLFDSLDSCNYYRSTHLAGKGTIYEVELLETKAFFEGDMKIIDKIENQILYHDLLSEFIAYWEGRMTETPVKEIIFQGKYQYHPID